MAQYSQKTIQNLKPDWYMSMSGKEKQDWQKDMQEERKIALENKPAPIRFGTKIIAKETGTSLTKGCEYKVMGHFCTLVTTIYGSKWNQFVTLKNKYGHTVKMNLNNFDINP